MDSWSSSTGDASHLASRRATVIDGHLRQTLPSSSSSLQTIPCLHYTPSEISEEPPAFNSGDLRLLMDGHHLEARDWLFRVMEESPLFYPSRRGGGVAFVTADYNQTKEQQREMTMLRIGYLKNRGVFDGWLTGKGIEAEKRNFAFLECFAIYDYSFTIKLEVHFLLW